MQPLYTHYDEFSCYVSHQNSKRLLAILDIVSTTVFFAARNATRGLAETAIEISNEFKPEYLLQVKDVPLSMAWLAEGKAYSKRLASTLRDELEELGLWTVDRQPPRLGISQPITKLREFNWRGLFNLAKAAVHRLIELHGEDDRSPDWTKLLPSHEFAWFSNMFLRAFGMPLFSSEEEIFSGTKPLLEEYVFKREISFLDIEQYYRSRIKLPALVRKAVEVVKSAFAPKNWGKEDDPIWNVVPY